MEDELYGPGQGLEEEHRGRGVQIAAGGRHGQGRLRTEAQWGAQVRPCPPLVQLPDPWCRGAARGRLDTVSPKTRETGWDGPGHYCFC